MKNRRTTIAVLVPLLGLLIIVLRAECRARGAGDECAESSESRGRGGQS